MDSVNLNLPANLFVSPPALPGNVMDGFVVDLNPGQLVRATVIEGELGRAILEINRQQYLAQGERELQVGQKLNLQVIQTQPRVEFKVLSDPLTDRLNQTLPLLTRSFDWGQLMGQLRQQLDQSSLPPATMKVYNQLQQILNPPTGVPVDFKGNLALVTAQLQQLAVTTNGLQGNLSPPQVSPQLMPLNYQPPVSSELSPTIVLLFKNLQNQLSLLPKSGGGPLPKSWYAETRSLLTPFRGGRGGQQLQLPLPQQQLLVPVLKQLQQHPRVSPQLAAEVERILIQIERQVTQGISQPVTKGLVVKTPSPGVQPSPQNLSPLGSVAGATGEKSLALLSADIKQLLDQVQQGQGHGQGQGQKLEIAPELLGRLEGLLSRLQQLPQIAGAASVLLPGFEAIMSQLSQLVTQPSSTPQGGELGLLSQLFGFHLETELLQGKKKAALASLKLSLLNLQKELGEEVKEPLRRIELFQLCKAKLAEDQVQFLPLPFSELEEGYLLAEGRSEADKDSGSGESPLQLSLSLRLSALGNVRIDMLYEKDGLHLRLAGEDRGKMRYLQSCTDELKESLQAIELQGVSFSADAQLPARQLQERLLPDSANMLDARI